MSELKNRIDFVYIFDVQDGNPNGDRMQVIFPVWMQKLVWDWLQMFVSNVRCVIMYKWQKDL